MLFCGYDMREGRNILRRRIFLVAGASEAYFEPARGLEFKTQKRQPITSDNHPFVRTASGDPQAPAMQCARFPHPT